jgi:hypothetical protein
MSSMARSCKEKRLIKNSSHRSTYKEQGHRKYDPRKPTPSNQRCD